MMQVFILLRKKCGAHESKPMNYTRLELIDFLHSIFGKDKAEHTNPATITSFCFNREAYELAGIVGMANFCSNTE